MAASPSRSPSPSLRGGVDALRTLIDHKSTRSKGQSLYNVNTSLSQHVTITPASARSLSSVAPSPYMNSLQSSPDCLDGQELSSVSQSPVPLELPEPLLSSEFPGKLFPKEPVAPAKGPGLMRKLSQSARTGVHSTGKRLVRKASSTPDKREHSAGPITRRRSDSKTSTPNSATADMPLIDFEETRSIDSLGLNGSLDGLTITSEPGLSQLARLEGAAPTIPDLLIRGSQMSKVTKKRRKQLTFYVAVDGSKVFWNLTKQSKRFCVDDIKEIRIGAVSQHYCQELGASLQESERWLTILYFDQARSKQQKVMHLIADRKEDALLWKDSLDALSRHRTELMEGLSGSLEMEHVIKVHWERELAKISAASVSPVSTEDSLDYQAIENLSQSLHIHCSKSMLREQFRLADSRCCGRLNYQEFRNFVRQIKERKDLKQIYHQLTKENGFGMTQEMFFSFLRNEQGVDVDQDVAKWTAEFNQWVRASSTGSSSGQSSPVFSDVMTLEAFSSFMVSSSCSIYAPVSEAVFDRPMNEYFISTSHNTYLSGRQVAGESTTEAYISALRKGCRCVEIDCWNGSDGKPIVTHGHTRTKPVLFSDCVTVISRYAFDASPYPLVLSLEVHCDAEQQGKMVQIMKDGFGDRLVLYPLHDSHQHILPTPEELKYRILVKVKSSSIPDGQLSPEKSDIGRCRSTSSPYVAPVPLNDSPSILSLPGLSNTAPSSPPMYAGPLFSPSQRSMTATSASSAGEDSDSLLGHSRSSIRRNKKPTSKITRKLADLGVYFQGYKYRSLNAPESGEYNHIFSLDETKAARICRDALSKAQFEDHNLRHMMRVYPKGIRIASSNFDPIAFWRRGVQMVALNWQTYDPFMQVHQAMFAAGNDRYGYVLKPEYLRPADLGRCTAQELVNRHVDLKHSVSFSVKMISAQQLPRLRTMAPEKTINPFVEIQMFTAEDRSTGGMVIGSDDTGVEKVEMLGLTPFSRSTSVVADNGYNPIFDKTITLKLETRHPDLVFVRFIVWHSPNIRIRQDPTKSNTSGCHQLAVFTAKLSSLQQGYRHLPLYNGNGEEFVFSSLFCKIKKEKPVVLPNVAAGLSSRSGRAGVLRTVIGGVRRTLSSDRESVRRLEAVE